VGGSRPRFGVIDGEHIIEMRGSPFTRHCEAGRSYDLANVKLLPPTLPRAMYSANGTTRLTASG